MNVALVHNLQGLIKKLCGAFLRLFLKAFALARANFQQWQGAFVFCHQHIAHMRGQSVNKVARIKAFGNDVVNKYHDVAHLVLHGQVDNAEIVVAIKHVKVGNNAVVCKVALCKARSLVENRKRIAHAAVCFLGNYGQSLLFVSNSFVLGHAFKVVDDARDGHPFKVVNLATRQNGGQNLVFLGCGQDENDVCGRLFQCFKEGIKGRGGKHVHLVDDENLIFSHLRRDARLVHQRLNVLNRVVAGRV